ncbi:MAG: CehA/McbA family metallohydrolase, partial [Planctomycetaceae bacterium]|nr:CehA/McbA family metallohydrolase [Planctomycetaceae bacterium]
MSHMNHIVNIVSSCCYMTALILVASLSAELAAAETGTILFQVNNGEQQPLPCRVHLFDALGKPHGAPGQPFWNDHFVCNGRASVEVPPGEYTWQIERGPEHEQASGTVTVSVDQTAIVNITIKRIASLRDEGWYSGDLHVHRPVDEIEQLMLAEDLDFAPVIEWWNAPGGQLPEGKQTQVTFDGGRIYELRAGEDEREGGALLYFGLDSPLDLTAKSREVPTPMQFVGRARQLNADVWIDIEKPFWWDVPTWLASGQMNSIGLANNHMCRSRMLENEAWGRLREVSRLPNPNGNGYWTQEIYYHVLNAGLRIPPSAGSASGVLPNPVGYNRVYVHPGEREFTRDAWFAALAQGRCFVTNGPLLRVTANGELPGHVMKLSADQPREMKLQIALTSNDPVSHVEVIHNGQIVNRIPCSDETGQSLSASLTVNEPGWFLVRAIADVDSTFRFASTAPWYIDGPAGEQRISKSSAEFFLKWVDERIERVYRNVTDADDLRTVLEPHLTSQVFWQNRVQMANADASGADQNTIEQTSLSAATLPMVSQVESQPLLASIARLIEAMDYIGSPLPDSVINELKLLSVTDDSREVTRRVQLLLDPHCLAGVSVRENGAPLVKPGQASRELLEQGWRTFLVKVVNKPGRATRLLVESPNAQPLPHAPADQVRSRWMQLSSFEGRPLKANLSGLELEYRIIQIYSRDTGPREAILEFTISSKAGDEGALIREWRFDLDTDGWREMNQIEIAAQDGSLNVTSTGEDPFMGADVKARGGPMLLRFWAQSEVDGIGQLFWWTRDIPQATGDRQTSFVLEPGREYLYEVPFHVEGELAGVRLDPLVKPGKTRIDWIDLYSAQRSDDWAKLPVSFDCQPATPVTFRVIDAEGLPAFARFEIRDREGRVYPAQSKRLAPDFFFHRQIYRGDGESIALPPGEYTIHCSRGPETIPETKQLVVGNDPTELIYRIDRWIDPSIDGWWSGDHHIHAAGCLHYNNPTEGVEPGDMIRHIMGEDLKVGCCLTWGPCFDFQKRFFTGEVAEQSQYPYTLRYDVEVSGFGSHASGHLNLLNLKQQIYPGGESKDHWPTLGLNTLRWAKAQGAVCGPAHSAAGITTFVGRIPDTDGKDGPNELPNFNIPAFDGIGANEFIVDVTHKVPGPVGGLVPAVDFISTMNTERVAEWNMWYHV